MYDERLGNIDPHNEKCRQKRRGIRPIFMPADTPQQQQPQVDK